MAALTAQSPPKDIREESGVLYRKSVVKCWVGGKGGEWVRCFRKTALEIFCN